MSDSKPVIDISDRKQTFETIRKRIEALNEGFRALYADYSHHIESTHGKQHEIFQLKENIDYRLFSSQFHLELLLRQHYNIETRIQTIYNKEPSKILGDVYPSNPIFDHCQNEITSIFDSIIFHLASVYDYLSAIIHFICNKKDKSVTKWSQLLRFCRDETNTVYQNRSIGNIIKTESNGFVDKLYRYRSRVIHEKTDINPISFTLKLASGQTEVKFIARDSLTRAFGKLKEKQKTHDMTIAFVSQWLINTTIESISNILFGLKDDMECKSTFPHHIGPSDLIFLYAGPNGVAQPASKPMWENVKKVLTELTFAEI